MHNSIMLTLNSSLSIESIQKKLQCEIGTIAISNFPDGESHIKICDSVEDKYVFLIVDLSHPNDKLLNILLITNTLKKMKAKRIILVAPYLPYMRQDCEFHPGEVVSAPIFASILSSAIDGLITVDPHLHRIHHLRDIYPLSAIATLHASNLIAEWISMNIKNAFLLGPDEESFQWLSDVAHLTKCDFAVAKKIRLGDRKVEITLPDGIPTNKHILIIDDIISSGSSLLTLSTHLTKLDIQQMSCITVHALFNNAIYDKLLNCGIASIISTNSIKHVTNQIDLSPIIAAEMFKMHDSFTA